MSNLMSYDQLEMVRYIKMIRAIHLTNDASMELIRNPFKFFPFLVDPINFSSRNGFLEPTGTCSPLRGGQ